jgi:excisionase family DNA binding protein
MKTSRRRVRRVAARPPLPLNRWPAALGSVARQVEIPLPAALKEDRSLEGGSVALVEVGKDHLKLRFLRPSLMEDEGSTLTSSEEAALAKGGVEHVSEKDVLVVQAQAVAAYQDLRARSLTVDEAARRLGVNTSRIRQRLAARSLYGLKDGNTWLLPAFQFGANGLVPGVSAVVRRLPPDLGALAAARWFSSPNPDLCTRDDDERPLTPLQWLLRGNPPEAAAELAAAL